MFRTELRLFRTKIRLSLCATEIRVGDCYKLPRARIRLFPRALPRQLSPEGIVAEGSRAATIPSGRELNGRRPARSVRQRTKGCSKAGERCKRRLQRRGGARTILRRRTKHKGAVCTRAVLTWDVSFMGAFAAITLTNSTPLEPWPFGPAALPRGSPVRPVNAAPVRPVARHGSRASVAQPGEARRFPNDCECFQVAHHTLR